MLLICFWAEPSDATPTSHTTTNAFATYGHQAPPLPGRVYAQQESGNGVRRIHDGGAR